MLDWDDLRFFLAVARHRTLAAAARHLHVTQSTVGRRLASLQAGMGVRLLRRTAEGYALTLAGESIRAHVERVEAEAIQAERAVAGHDARLEGLVRVTSSQMLTSHLLAPSFAVRLRRFEHGDVVVRSVGVLAFGLYACLAYLARHGEPDLGEGCAGHHLITLLDDRDVSAQAAWFAEHAGRARVVLKADSYETQHWATYCSGGLALLPRFRADAEPALRRIATPAPVPAAAIWLGVHREDRATPRVRTVLDCVAEAVRGQSAILNPGEPAGETARAAMALDRGA